MFKLRQGIERAKSKQRFTVGHIRQKKEDVKFLKQERAGYFLGIKIIIELT